MATTYTHHSFLFYFFPFKNHVVNRTYYHILATYYLANIISALVYWHITPIHIIILAYCIHYIYIYIFIFYLLYP